MPSVCKVAHIVFMFRAQTSRPADFIGFPQGRFEKAKSSKVASSIPKDIKSTIMYHGKKMITKFYVINLFFLFP